MMTRECSARRMSRRCAGVVKQYVPACRNCDGGASGQTRGGLEDALPQRGDRLAVRQGAKG